MRLNRTTGSTPAKSATPAAPAAPAGATQAATNQDVQESFVQSDQVDDREAAPKSAEEAELLALFPGIAEGLTPEYLDLGWEMTDPVEGSQELECGMVGQEQVLGRSETVHLKKKLLKELRQHAPAVRSLLEGVLENEEALASFIDQEQIGDVDEFLDQLQDLTQVANPVSSAQLFKGDLYQSIQSYSLAYFSHRYALELVDQTKRVMSSNFPELFMDLPVMVKVVEANQNNASHEWVSGKHRLTLQVKESFGDSREDIGDLVSTGSFDQAYHFRRGITDLVSFIHEYAHAIYDKVLGVPASIKLTRVNRVISEGFAILLELLAIDSLQSECCDMDHRDFQERREQRVSWLRQALEPGAEDSIMAYAEGVELMVNVFREGGLTGVAEFIGDIQPTKADGLKRSNARYQEAITDPDLVLELVS